MKEKSVVTGWVRIYSPVPVVVVSHLSNEIIKIGSMLSALYLMCIEQIFFIRHQCVRFSYHI